MLTKNVDDFELGGAAAVLSVRCWYVGNQSILARTGNTASVFVGAENSWARVWISSWNPENQNVYERYMHLLVVNLAY